MSPPPNNPVFPQVPRLAGVGKGEYSPVVDIYPDFLSNICYAWVK